MKRIFPIFITLVLVAILGSTLLSSCGESANRKRLRKEIQALNSECPKPLTGDITLTEAKLEGDSVVYICYYDEQQGSIESMAKDKGLMKLKMQNALARTNFTESKGLLEVLDKENLYLKYSYTGSKSKKQLSVLITPDDVRTIRNTASDLKAVSKQTLELTVRQTRMLLPMVVDTGMTCTKVEYADNYLRYTYEVDEDIYDIASINAARSEIKQDILKDLKNSIGTAMLQSIIDAESQLEYTYQGNRSRQNTSIGFTINDLKEALNN